jgi:hypothetical protein
MSKGRFRHFERLSEMVQRHIDDELLAGAVTLVSRKGSQPHVFLKAVRDWSFHLR